MSARPLGDRPVNFRVVKVQAVNDRFGTSDGYLEAIGVGARERDRLAELYLEPRR